MHILEQLWNGQICPADQPVHQWEAYRELATLYKRNEDNLRSTLTPKQQEDLQKITDLWEDMDRITESSAFIRGFQLAVQLMTAAVS